jgi:hypothetical protein
VSRAAHRELIVQESRIYFVNGGTTVPEPTADSVKARSFPDGASHGRKGQTPAVTPTLKTSDKIYNIRCQFHARPLSRACVLGFEDK